MSNMKALRRLADGRNLKLKELHCNASGYCCQHYHMLASSCVHNYRTSDGLTRHSAGSPFTISSNHEKISCISDFHVLNRYNLARNCLHGNAYRHRDSHSALLNPWKETLSSSQRQFSLSPKVILEASPKPLQPYLRLIRFDKPIGKYK